MPDIAAALLAAVDGALPRLGALSDADADRRAAPGKWSPREIIGHLVDSAANNHARFVRAQLQDDLVFPGYAQDDWVRLQGYASAPWPELVRLWELYNRHLARVIARVPAEVATRPRPRHNLHEIAYRPVSPERPATLGYFMSDYVRHLEHHLSQIRALTGD